MDFTYKEIMDFGTGWRKKMLIRKDFADLIDEAKRINPHCTVYQKGGEIELKIRIKF